MSNRLLHVLVIGASGQLGAALAEALERRSCDPLRPSRADLDAADGASVASWLDSARPSAVLNASAYTDVAAAERPEHHAAAFRLNRDAPVILARACAARALPLLHVSTDFVFDGASRRPYREDDPPRPLQVYGASKLEGEQGVLAAHPAALVVRTSTLFGTAARPRPNYVDSILAQARRSEVISVMVPPVSSPTFAPDLAEGILALLERGAAGLFHVTNEGECSRLALAREVVRAAGRAGVVRVEPRPAPPEVLRRPEYSVLDNARFASVAGFRLRAWQEAVLDHVRRRS